MSRLPLLAVAAALVAGGAGIAPANASTICVQNVCVCTHEYRCIFDQQMPDPLCVRADIDGDGHYETVCV